MRCLSLLTVRQDYLSGKRLCTLESGCPLTLCERKREEKEGGSGEKKNGTIIMIDSTFFYF